MVVVAGEGGRYHTLTRPVQHTNTYANHATPLARPGHRTRFLVFLAPCLSASVSDANAIEFWAVSGVLHSGVLFGVLVSLNCRAALAGIGKGFDERRSAM